MDALQDEKDYKTIVHTFSVEKLASVLRTKFSADGKCKEGAAGLKEEQARMYFETFGKNAITPPPRENIWLKLIRQIFCGIFNILLWSCVIAEVALILCFSKSNIKAETAAPAAGAAGAAEEQQAEAAGEEESDYVTPIILSAVIVMAAVLQWFSEIRAESQMEAMQKMQAAAAVTTVRRDSRGNRLDLEIDPVNLVPGDVIFLESGARIPADIRILHCTDGMEVDNSALTGESMPEPRHSKVEKECAPTEARNLAFFGTTVLKGTATAVVHATGDNTFLGKIAQGIKSSRVKSTLEIQIEHFVHIIAAVAICVGILSLISNLVSPVERSPSDILQNSAAALFAQVPEGLLPTVTISLMIASDQMARRAVIVRKIDAVETLGCVSVFCSDKTGTLTTGEMTVQDLVVPKNGAERIGSDGLDVFRRTDDGVFPVQSAEERIRWISQNGVLNNAAEFVADTEFKDLKASEPGGSREWSETWKARGSPTEVAILRACVDVCGGPLEMRRLRESQANVFTIPFNSENKWMLTIHINPKTSMSSGQSCLAILKGAPERVLKFCKVNNDAAAMAKIDATLQSLMNLGRRVLCIAKRDYNGAEVPKGGKFEGTEAKDCNFPMTDFVFVGLYGIEDPPKPGVADAVLQAQDAGVKVIMVTGDHPDTARAIASRINIVDGRDLEGDSSASAEFAVITGAMLENKVPKKDSFSDEDPLEMQAWWRKAVQHTKVFARVSPIHKQTIVQAYQHFGYAGTGDIVAMTGDGVNDAPALKQAEVGVAMGQRGTEVAKDAADIVLHDDNFTSVIKGMEQGRLSSENLQKSIMYTLCSKVPQVAPTFGELFGIPQALTVAQVLLIDIGTDIWTAIAYAVQSAESKLMQRPPRHPRCEKMVNQKVLIYSYGYIGIFQMFFCWLMFFWAAPGIWELYLSGKSPNDYTEDEEFANVQGMTVYYWTLVLGQIAAAISTTTKVQSVFGLGGPAYGFPNMPLNCMFLGETLLGLMAIYLGFMHSWFETGWLPANAVFKPMLAFVAICLIDEIRKLVARLAEQ